MNKAKKGFTLVEIMIVVAIIAILAAVAIPNFIGYRKSANRASCIANLKQLDTATETWRVNLSKKPTDMPVLSDLCKEDGSKLIKKAVSDMVCPEDGKTAYTPPTTTTGDASHWSCGAMGTDTDYPHKIED